MRNQTDTYTELQNRIKSLKENRARKETLILKDLSKVYAITQSPASYIKQVTGALANDKDFRLNLLKIGLTLGTNYLAKFLAGPEKTSTVLSNISEKLGLKQDAKSTIASLLIRLLSKSDQKEQSK